MKTILTNRFGLTAAVALFAIQHATGAIIMEWDASNWSGSGGWTDSASGELLSIGAGAPTRAVDLTTFAGSNQAVTAAVFDGTSGFVSDGSTPMDGLKEFTISAVIRVGATPGAGANANPWNYNMIVGLELPSGGQGEFQFGFDGDNRLNAGVGFGGGGDASHVGGIVPANTWATVAMVVRQNPTGANDGEFEFATYLNGASFSAPTVVNYAGLNQVVASAFGVGYNVIGNADRRFFTGEIAHLRFDDTALDSTALVAEAGTYLGTLEAIPEPSSAIMALFGTACLVFRRRK